MQGGIAVPGDKSISHRAVLLGAIADGETVIEGFGRSADTESTIAAVRALGVEVGEDGRHRARRGRGPARAARAGRSRSTAATPARSFGSSPGILAGQEGKRFELTGDESLSRRPMGRIAEPLDADGRRVETTGGGLPLRIDGACPAPAALRAARRERAGEVVRPARGPVRRGRADDGRRARRRRATTPSGCCAPPGATVRDLAGSGRGAAGRAARPAPPRRSRRLLLGRAVPRRRDAAARLASAHRRRRRQPDPHRPAATCSSGWARGSRSTTARASGGEPVADIEVEHADLVATEIEPGRGARMIDELPLFALAASMARGESVRPRRRRAAAKGDRTGSKR